MLSKITPVMIASLTSFTGLCMAQSSESPGSQFASTNKWDITLSLAVTSADVEIVDSEIVLPEGLSDSDFDVSLTDELSISSTIVSGSVGYRILPFLDLSARAGFASSDSETGLTLTGTPTGAFGDFFDGPITVDRDANIEVDGYSLGLGAIASIPLADIGGDKLASYTSLHYAWNRFDDDTIVSEAARTSIGLVFPIDPARRNRPVYRLAGSYNWITRDVERDLLIGGETVNVKITQEFKNPWAVELGAGFPIAPNAMLGVSVSQQMSGEASGFAFLRFSFD